MMFKKRLLLAFFTSINFFNFLEAQTIYIQEDFNAGSLPTGWTNSALSGSVRWQFGNNGSSFHTGNTNINGSNFVYFDDDSLGGTSLNNTAQLSTPIFDNSLNSTSFLEFDYNFRDYASSSDSLYVEVFDGTNWNLVFSTKVDDCGRYTGPSPTDCEINGFPHSKIDISSYANSNCIVKFIYHDGDDWAWYAGIDNVEVYSPEPNDIGVVSIDNPKIKSCKLSKHELISCTIKNFSPDTINSFELIARVDSGNKQVIDTITTQLLPFDSLQYTFTKGVDLSLSKAYHLSIHSNYTLDQKSSNDSSSVSIPARSIKTLPYSEGFESANHDWELSGDSINWERGLPKANFISQAAKGSNAFVTNLNGNYSPNQTSYLTSPCIELDSINGKYLLSVDLTFDTEGGFDPLFLEYSYNGGNTWQKLDKSLVQFNWYNLSSSKTWGGKKNNWKNYSTSFIGQSASVKFRFVFKSDAVNHFEGVGVDNFTVSVIDDKQLKINSVIAPLELPTYECGLSGKEKVKVSLLNIGSSTIDSLKLSYQIESRPKVVQWFYGLLKADSIKSFEFTEKANLFTRKIYRLKIFLEYEKTSITGYDTITRFINNEYYVQKTAPYFENFDEMTPISRFIFPFTPPIDSLSIEWSRDPKLIDRKEYTWVVASDTAYNSRIGPIKDNTGNNGNYLYSVNISNTTVNSEAKVSSPCILINSQNAELSFWYHRTNVYEASYIDIYENGAWNLSVDTISAAIPAVNTDSFKQKIFDLSEYESQKIKIRFTIGTPVGIQQMAIDDFHIYDSSAINERFLQTPIKGVYGQDYALVNYVDWIGTGYQDAYCGTKSYDGHEGTDFTLRSFRQMDSGVYVLAADTGIVTFVKDSLFDREKVSDPAKGLGNYIAIKHPNDFYTYYGHLKKYSLLVNVGDTVSASQRIAEVGSSGNSTDPHLHFELWYDSLYVVDPFSGDCGNDSTLWINPLPYDTILTVWESGLYLKNIGIDNLRERDTTSICCPYELTNQGDTLSYWSHLLGLRTGDTLTIDWLDSAATNQFSYDFVMQQDWWYYYFWSYITTQNISIGDWQVFLSRNSEVIDSLNFEVKLNPITQLKEVSIKTTNCEPIASLGQEELILLDQRNQLEVFNHKGQRIQSPSKFLSTKPEPSISSIYIVRIISAEQECIYKVLR